MESVDHAPYSYTSIISSTYLPPPAERTRLDTLLRSNCAPPAATDYRLQVVPSLAKVAEYDAEISKLRQLLHRMVADRAILQYHAEGCLSVYAPIRRLPNELLLQIFYYCCPPTRPRELDAWDLRSVEQNTDCVAQKHLRQLAQVCSSWRGLALGSPSLWSTIELDFAHCPRPENEEYIERRMGLLRSSLERSAVAPLHLYVRTRTLGLMTEGDMLHLLARNSARWQNAKIWTDHHQQAREIDEIFKLLAPAKGNLPLLENLHLGGKMPAGCDIFEIAPRLTELTIEEPIPVLPKLPWGQLRTVSYTALFPEELATAIAQLSHCSAMSQLAFYRLYISDVEEDHLIPTFISDIDTLIITFLLQSLRTQESVAVSDIFGSITLRRTSALHLMTCNYSLPWPQSAFLAFASRSSFHDTLKTLEIANMRVPSADFLQCLSGLPRLEVLTISDPKVDKYSRVPDLFLIDNSLFRGLTWTSSTTSLIPRLHTFTCETYMQFEDHIYLDFIASRLEPGRTTDGPFETSLFRYRGGDLNPLLAERLAAFVRQKDLKLRLERESLDRWPVDASYD